MPLLHPSFPRKATTSGVHSVLNSFSSRLVLIAVSSFTLQRVLRHSPRRPSSKFRCSPRHCPGGVNFSAPLQ